MIWRWRTDVKPSARVAHLGVLGQDKCLCCDVSIASG